MQILLLLHTFSDGQSCVAFPYDARIHDVRCVIASRFRIPSLRCSSAVVVYFVPGDGVSRARSQVSAAAFSVNPTMPVAYDRVSLYSGFCAFCDGHAVTAISVYQIAPDLHYGSAAYANAMPIVPADGVIL